MTKGPLFQSIVQPLNPRTTRGAITADQNAVYRQAFAPSYRPIKRNVRERFNAKSKPKKVFSKISALHPQMKERYGFEHRSSKLVAVSGCYRLTASLDKISDINVWTSFSDPRVVQNQQSLVTFNGRLESKSTDSAQVLLVESVTGKRFSASCELKHFDDSNISEGDEFHCKVVKDSRGVHVLFEKAEERRLSLSEIEEIESRYSAPLVL